MTPSNEIYRSWEFDDELFSGGVHLCYIYSDDAARERTMAKFFARGIAAGQKALCLVDAVSPYDIRTALARLGVDLAARAGDFTTLENDASYCPDGAFDPDKLLSGVGGFCAQARAEGYGGARISGDMAWVLRRGIGIRALMEYESKVTEYLRSCPFTAICEYDARRFDGSALMDVLAVHPAMIVQDLVVRNPYFIPPAEFLRLLAARRG